MAMMVSATDTRLTIDLVVDTSAVIAVILQEAGYDFILERLCRSSHPAISAPTRTEILIVALRKLGEVGKERTREFLDQQAVATVTWDQDLADAAAAAFQHFGKGRHPSGLNYGDCFSYVLAD